MKIALLCSGLGNIHRGHEVFARELFDLLESTVDITLFKGAGLTGEREYVVDHVSRNSGLLDHIQLPVSPKWQDAAREQERLRVEGETFAYAALKQLLEGEYDIIHCLEQEVCNVIYDHRHLFKTTPKVVFSNGGAIPARDLPRCDFVQEHTAYNLRFSAKNKAFMIPHGVDTSLFRPGIETTFRQRHRIPEDATLILSVGTICYWHKRMDYVIQEVASVPNAYLAIVGQEGRDSPSIKELGRRLMGDRIVFDTLPHEQLPTAYAAADIFVLGSLFETFGIVFIEAMAMGLPVICTNHPNQRSIVGDGIFVDMRKNGALTKAILETDPTMLSTLGQRGREAALENYDLKILRKRYQERYLSIANTTARLPAYTITRRIFFNAHNTLALARRLIFGRAE